MTACALAAAPVAATPRSAASLRPAPDDGVFAGLLAGAGAAPAPAAAPAAEVLPPEDLPPEEGPVLPDGALLAAQVLGLVPPPLPRGEAPAGGTEAPARLQAAAPLGDATVLVPQDVADAATVQGPGTDATALPVHDEGTVPAQVGPATAQTPAPARDATGTPDAGTPGPEVPGAAEPSAPVPAAETPLPGVVPDGAALPAAGRVDLPADGAAAPGSEQVRPAVAELARGLRDAGGGRASLVVRLDPPELGPVLVRLTVVDGRVDVQLRTAEAVAAVGLSAASAEVRSTLLEHGLDLSSFDVREGDVSGGTGPSQRDASSDRGTPRRGGSADRSASAPGAATGAVLDDSPADGAAAGTWL